MPETPLLMEKPFSFASSSSFENSSFCLLWNSSTIWFFCFSYSLDSKALGMSVLRALIRSSMSFLRSCLFRLDGDGQGQVGVLEVVYVAPVGGHFLAGRLFFQHGADCGHFPRACFSQGKDIEPFGPDLEPEIEGPQGLFLSYGPRSASLRLRWWQNRTGQDRTICEDRRVPILSP